VEVLEVAEFDEGFRYHRIDGCIPYAVKYKADDGLLYFQQVWAKDELDAYLQMTTGNFSELNLALQGATHAPQSTEQEAGR